MSKPTRKRWKDPGVVMVITLSVIALFVWIWWPTETFVGGISLAGWAMFVCFFIWLFLTTVYVVWMERLEKNK
ncbi:hypothetical protein [Halobacillus karajensis]|uniref:Uncharacterized protein n=1 Tax=Halobacillus karajensis TaxID=195088 RepID=A0A024P199_9BACI|nr:hypothetical protein [Halobacillus karajensis]CDQ19370.1 hypothetical protein BN982_01663 [Halobacillus karajensis]CDQ21833.1 hypothetical protein BN983_00027 [Halobacillus karajensis]CDQ27673.1 hypothetical protein BN981_01953 [Halobacillus karajensis]